MRKPTSGPFVEFGPDPDDRLPVLLKSGVKAGNGQEFLAGQLAGFSIRSAVSLVIAKLAAPYVTEENVEKWGKGFAAVQAEPPSMEDCAGPLVAHLRERMAEAAALEAQALAEQRSMEEETAARKAKQDAEDAEAARLAALQTPAVEQAPVKSVDTVSNPDVTADEVLEPTPAPAPTPPAPTTKRGSKTPRS